MIHELDRADYAQVAPLFHDLEFQPFCLAVLAGLHPGRVFVDDPGRPAAAFLSREDPWCYLAGDPGRDAFNRALNEAIYAHDVVPGYLTNLFLTCDPGDWDGQLPAVFAPRAPVTTSRRHYEASDNSALPALVLPDGFTLRPMDEALRADPRLDVPPEVIENLDKWSAMPAGRLHDFGFVAVDEQAAKIAAWATVDAIVDGIGDAGLFTQAEYRRRGLAEAVTAAALRHGLAHGMRAIHWTCTHQNAGSIRIAEKLGLVRQADYLLHFFAFDEAEHLTTGAYYQVEAGRYAAAVAALERALALRDAHPFYVYHDAARAWAGVGDHARAFALLRRAVDGGWEDVDETRSSPEFVGYHGLPEWEALIEAMRE
ncbi:MAG: GNAT family N-acetyltransferase [Anaerolineae bacterium]|nr:GNAT family N-acetyltransferase [Anaerolineae bacterium]